MFNWSIDIKPWKRDLKSWDSLTKKAENLFIDILKSDLDFEKYYSIFLKWPSKKIVEETLNKENKSLILLSLLLTVIRHFMKTIFQIIS